MDVHAGEPLGDSPRFRVALSLHHREVPGDQPFLVHVDSGPNDTNNCIVEQLEISPRVPLVLDRLQRIAVLARSFGLNHQVAQRLQG